MTNIFYKIFKKVSQPTFPRKTAQINEIWISKYTGKPVTISAVFCNQIRFRKFYTSMDFSDPATEQLFKAFGSYELDWTYKKFYNEYIYNELLSNEKIIKDIVE
jgi:hypothetical protein